MCNGQPLEHAWKEYAETLHPQYGQQDGERHLLRLRATVPAETFFNTAVLVDTPLRTEFFKHLPGMLTGIGIIGTFWGLISGLQYFNVNTDSQTLQQNLALLLQGVREAFIGVPSENGLQSTLSHWHRALTQNRSFSRVLDEKAGHASVGVGRAILKIHSRIWPAEKPSFEDGYTAVPSTAVKRKAAWLLARKVRSVL